MYFINYLFFYLIFTYIKSIESNKLWFLVSAAYLHLDFVRKKVFLAKRISCYHNVLIETETENFLVKILISLANVEYFF